MAWITDNPVATPALKGGSTKHTFTFEGLATGGSEADTFRFLNGLKSLSWVKSKGYFYGNKKSFYIPKWRYAYPLLFCSGIHKLYFIGLDYDTVQRLNNHLTTYISSYTGEVDNTTGQNFMNFVYAIRHAEGFETPLWFVPKPLNAPEVSMSVSGGGDSDYFCRGRSKFYSSHKKVTMGKEIQSHSVYRLCGR